MYIFLELAAASTVAFGALLTVIISRARRDPHFWAKASISQRLVSVVWLAIAALVTASMWYEALNRL
jgi:hypothetical protein